MSDKLVPLTIIKGAGHEFIPLENGENATVADFHSIRTQTVDSPSYLTSGFYKITAGPARPAHYTFEESKFVLNGQIDILVSSTKSPLLKRSNTLAYIPVMLFSVTNEEKANGYFFT